MVTTNSALRCSNKHPFIENSSRGTSESSRRTPGTWTSRTGRSSSTRTTSGSDFYLIVSRTRRARDRGARPRRCACRR